MTLTFLRSQKGGFVATKGKFTSINPLAVRRAASIIRERPSDR
jgi:hypothetical protein